MCVFLLHTMLPLHQYYTRNIIPETEILINYPFPDIPLISRYYIIGGVSFQN
jgi:hypothetical protein